MLKFDVGGVVGPVGVRVVDAFVPQGTLVDLETNEGEYRQDEDRQNHDVTQSPHSLHQGTDDSLQP